MRKNERDSHFMQLYITITHLKTPEECLHFFEDLCTPIEIRSMEQRFRVAVSLYLGTAYSQVKEETSASSATISRVRRFLLNDGAGGVMKDILGRYEFERKANNEGVE